MKERRCTGCGMPVSLAVVFLLLVSSLPCHAAAVNLPRTGQTVCTDTSGTPISCAGTGQDGEKQSGVAWPSPRFTVGTGPEAACVTDNLTGLMWGREGHQSVSTKTWQEALSHVSLMNLLGGDCGHSDWRLPNINELESLYNADSTLNSTWLASQGFSNIERYFWSSTTYANDSTLAWLADLHYGHIQTCKKVGTGGCKTYVMQVRTASAGTAPLWETGQTKCYSEAGAEIACAGTGQDGEKRAGTAWPATRFSDNGNGTVTDNLTGVIWLQDADCFGLRTWPEALSDAAALSSGQCGLTDGSVAGEWRLPNRKEQFSLTDRSLPTPALSAGHPFQSVVSYIYWASTSFAENAASAWYWTPAGSTSSYPKSTTGYVWPVYDPRKELTTVVWTGGGAGTGTVMPSCEAGCWYAKGQQVAITAIPDPFNILSFWLGDCVGYALETSVTMDAARSCTAAFTPCGTSPANNQSSGESSIAIQPLYNLSTTINGHTIRLIATKLIGNLSFDSSLRADQSPVDITLQGGWSCSYFARDFLGSFVQGTVTIIDGSVTFDGIVIL